MTNRLSISGRGGGNFTPPPLLTFPNLFSRFLADIQTPTPPRLEIIFEQPLSSFFFLVCKKCIFTHNVETGEC